MTRRTTSAGAQRSIGIVRRGSATVVTLAAVALLGAAALFVRGTLDPVIYIGVAGWSYADWEGVVYPRAKPRDFHALPYLARFVDCVEINSTFYALPQERNARRWVDLVADRPDFRFLVKLHRSFTHEPLSGDMDRAAHTFSEGIAPLSVAGVCLGLLVQLPFFQRLDDEGRRRLESIRRLFPTASLHLEPRHASWFTPEALAWLRGLDTGLVHVDMPSARDHPPFDHPSLSKLAYLRLHGRNRQSWFDKGAGRNERYDYLYDRKEVTEVTDRMRELTEKAGTGVLIANNHYAGQALANALEIKSLLTGGPVPAPEPLVRTYSELKRFTEIEGQQLLF